jgi:hypothetical protein
MPEKMYCFSVVFGPATIAQILKEEKKQKISLTWIG